MKIMEKNGKNDDQLEESTFSVITSMETIN